MLDQVKNLRLKAEILLGRADAHAGMAEYAQAVDLYDRVIELGSIDPQTLSEAFSGKGWALQCLGKTKAPEAKEAYEKAAELSPDNLWVQKGIANALRLCGEDQAAREKYEWVSDELERKGRPRAVLSSLGWCYYNLGRFDEAEATYRQVIASKPDPFSDVFDLGLILFCRGNIPEALQAYEQGLESIRMRHPPRSRLGLLYVARSDLQEAIECHPSLSRLEECHRVLGLLQAELLTSVPGAGATPRLVAEDTGHEPTNFTQLAIERRWPELQERLRPCLPELIQFVGLKGASSDDLLQFLLKRAQSAGVGPLRFRELLPGWLEEYAGRMRLSPPRPLRPEDWVTFIRRAAVRLVLDAVPSGEPGWARMFRLHARDATSWQEIAQLVPSEPPQPDALYRFRRYLVAHIRQVHRQAARDFELSSAA